MILSIIIIPRTIIILSQFFRGVVQLFNVVRQQQKSVNKTSKSARKMEIKREKLLENIDKKKFMNVLAGSVSP